MKVTQQDIADELHLSRNTVAKALRNDCLVSQDTIRRVQECARRMQYTKFSGCPETTSQHRMISVLMHSSAGNGNTFWIQVLSGVESIIRGKRFMMSVSFISSADELPVPDKMVAGYIVMGRFSIRDYYRFADIAKKKPLVFVDIASKIPLNKLERDIVLMENVESVREITQHMIHMGHKNIGFIGQVMARSVYDRYRGYRKALQDNDLKVQNQFCLLDFSDDYEGDGEGTVYHWLHSLKEMPTAFVCANDSIAFYLSSWLMRDFNLSVPKDVSLSGFDNLEEGQFCQPILTTVQCYKQELGKRAAEEVCWRMEQGEDRPYEIIRVGTKVLYRDSIAECKLEN